MWRVNRSSSKGFSEIGYTEHNILGKNLLNKPQRKSVFIKKAHSLKRSGRRMYEKDFQVPTDLTAPQGKLEISNRKEN